MLVLNDLKQLKGKAKLKCPLSIRNEYSLSILRPDYPFSILSSYLFVIAYVSIDELEEADNGEGLVDRSNNYHNLIRVRFVEKKGTNHRVDAVERDNE